MNLFKKKMYRDPVKIAKRLNEIFSNNSLIEEIVTSGKNYEGVFTSIIEYYVCTDDPKTNYTLEELMEKTTDRFSKIDFEKYYENIILAHSCNGHSKDNIRRNGLGKNNFFDEELGRDISLLEKHLGKSVYVDIQKNNSNETYITTPGGLSLQYAMKGSPERLILGILKQSYLDALPIKRGESKYEYYMRVLMPKIEKLAISENEKKELISASRRVLTKTCTKRPLMVLFPSVIGKQQLKAKISTSDNVEKNIADYVFINNDCFVDSGFDLFAGGTYSCNMANLVIDTHIPKGEIGIIEVPDFFEIAQMIMEKQNLEEYPLNCLSLKKVKTNDLTACYLGGTGEKYELKQAYKTFIYKPAVVRGTDTPNIPRGIVQECAYEVQKLVNPESAVFCKYVDNGEIRGSIQEKICFDKAKTQVLLTQEYYDFPKVISDQLLREFVTDFLLFNYDAHGKNFVVANEWGKQILYGLDKEQSFKYMFDDDCPKTPDINYHPNSIYGEKEPIYNTMFHKYIRNEINLNFSVLNEVITKIENVSDEYYKSIFKPYAESACREYGWKEEEFYTRIMDRKQNLRSYMDNFTKRLQNDRKAFIDEDLNNNGIIISMVDEKEQNPIKK